MAYPSPPQMDAAQQQLIAAIESVDQKKVDSLTIPWADLEKSVVKLLGGAFDIQKPEHQGVAMGLTAMFGGRLIHDFKAFWFPNRESIEGAVIGFPEALIMLSPFGAVADALGRAKLEQLDVVIKDIRSSLAKVKFAPSAGAGEQRLAPTDYQRLFDPGFIQFVALDPAKAKAGFESMPDKLLRDLRDALGRTGAGLPADSKKQFESQIMMAMQRLDPAKKVIDQVDRAPRVVELMGHLFGTTVASGSAPEEFWHDVVMPLLFIGAPEQFPPLDAEEIEAAKKGVDPLFVFLEVVPHQTPAPEDGLLGAFDLTELALPHPGLQNVPALRLIKVNAIRVKGLLEKFDPEKSRAALARFRKHLEEKAGTLPTPTPTAEGQQLFDAALALLAELRKTLAAGGDLCLRRITEAEASSEPAMGQVRAALNGPRIILA